MVKEKEPVKLRKKKLKEGGYSLYLDIYHNGIRDYEFLRLYLTCGTSAAAKQKDKETLQFANSVKAKRILEIRNGEYGFMNHFKINTNFFDYYVAFKKTKVLKPKGKTKDNSNYGNWQSAEVHLRRFCKKATTFKQIDRKFLDGFKHYLAHEAVTPAGQPLSQNSQCSYYRKLSACMKQALRDRIIPYNPCDGFVGPKQGEPEREYLTIEEVRKLYTVECRYPVLKRAFLFSCLTGLRWSDIHLMKWQQVHRHNDLTRIIFRQEKTGGQEYLDISPQALEFLGERGNSDLNERVFVGLRYSTGANTALAQWMLKAGITKDITFHCARHTFAVLMIDLGTEIYTVSKLLGHKDIKTTEIYTKVLDKRKQEAVTRIPSIT